MRYSSGVYLRPVYQKPLLEDSGGAAGRREFSFFLDSFEQQPGRLIEAVKLPPLAADCNSEERRPELAVDEGVLAGDQLGHEDIAMRSEGGELSEYLVRLGMPPPGAADRLAGH